MKSLVSALAIAFLVIVLLFVSVSGIFSWAVIFVSDIENGNYLSAFIEFIFAELLVPFYGIVNLFQFLF